MKTLKLEKHIGSASVTLLAPSRCDQSDPCRSAPFFALGTAAEIPNRHRPDLGQESILIRRRSGQTPPGTSPYMTTALRGSSLSVTDSRSPRHRPLRRNISGPTRYRRPSSAGRKANRCPGKRQPSRNLAANRASISRVRCVVWTGRHKGYARALSLLILSSLIPRLFLSRSERRCSVLSRPQVPARIR